MRFCFSFTISINGATLFASRNNQVQAMEIERITTTSHPLYADAIDLYKISFPLHEQREEKSQIAILSNPAYHFDVVCDNEQFVGEILYWEIGDFLYIEHFCVLPSMRNKHYGQNILDALKSKPLILEIDPPIDEISLRRKGFYERCGFVENSYKHIHPPYHKGNVGHELVVMSSPSPLTKTEYDVFHQALCDVVMKNVW